MPSKRSRVQPTQETKHRVTTWPEYDPARQTEARSGCDPLNRMLEIPRPRSVAIPLCQRCRDTYPPGD
jgi:hypothetical protein